MQIDTAATTERLAAAYAAAQAAIRALESIDVSTADDAAVELLRDRRNLVASELARRGLRDCGVCPAPKPAAVDWGHTCDLDDAGRADLAREMARHY